MFISNGQGSVKCLFVCLFLIVNEMLLKKALKFYSWAESPQICLERVNNYLT